MKRFVVLEPEGASAPSEEARVVHDGFTWAAVPLPAVWLAAQGAVVPAVLVLIVDAALLVATGAPSVANAALWLAVLLRIAVALEGPRLLLSRLRRRGWRETATLHAANRTEAEIVYFASDTTFLREGSASGWQGLVAALWRPLPRLGRDAFGAWLNRKLAR